MEASYWLHRWMKNEISFHQKETNPFLVEHLPTLSLEPGDRIFIPLCGKTLDIGGLLAQGYRVAGVELSKGAVEQLFAKLGMEPEISRTGELVHYAVKDLDLFVGNLFDLSREVLGPVDAIFDRAAIVALPPDMRIQYADHLMSITQLAPQLLVAYHYDQSLATGPPFSVPADELRQHYGTCYQMTLLDSKDLPSGRKGTEAKENVWHLFKINQQLTRPSHQPSAATPYPPTSTASEANSAPQRTESTPASQNGSSSLHLKASPASRDEVGEKSGLKLKGKT